MEKDPWKREVGGVNTTAFVIRDGAESGWLYMRSTTSTTDLEHSQQQIGEKDWPTLVILSSGYILPSLFTI